MWKGFQRNHAAGLELLRAERGAGAMTSAAAAPRPEEIGLSSARLARLGEVMRGEIERGRVPGAVALIARRGRLGYFESFGQRDAGRRRADDEGCDFSHLFHDQAHHVGRGDDAVGGGAVPAQRSHRQISS